MEYKEPKQRMTPSAPTSRRPIKQKIPDFSRGENTVLWIRQGKSDKQPTFRPTEYRCYIKEKVHYATAGAVTPSRNMSFVRHTTPHLDGTLREVSYSVRMYYTSLFSICKYLFSKQFILHTHKETFRKNVNYLLSFH